MSPHFFLQKLIIIDMGQKSNFKKRKQKWWLLNYG